MDWLPLALESIKRWEQCRLRAYLDAVGIWTIGWGSTGPDVRQGLVWTQEQADERLLRDVSRFAATVDARVLADLAPHEFAALVSFTYNVGAENFRKSTLLRLLNAGDKSGAAEQLGRWVYGTKDGKRIKLRGLVNRRAAERALFQGA